MFSDYGWSHPDFVKKCPKSVLQCPGYYNEDVQGYVIEKMKPCYQPRLKIFIELGKSGFDMVALPTNWVSDKLKASGRKDQLRRDREVLPRQRRARASEGLSYGILDGLQERIHVQVELRLNGSAC